MYFVVSSSFFFDARASLPPLNRLSPVEVSKCEQTLTAFRAHRKSEPTAAHGHIPTTHVAATRQHSLGIALKNRDRPCPACRRAADLDRETRDQKSVAGQRFKIMQLLDMAIADLAARLVPFPDDRGIACRGEALGGVEKRGIP